MRYSCTYFFFFIRRFTTCSEVTSPGPGVPSSSIQHSRHDGGGGPTLETDVARVLGTDSRSGERKDGERDVSLLELEDDADDGGGEAAAGATMGP